MATHSLTGAKSSTSRDKVVKPAMNQNEVQEIIGDNLIALIFTVFFSLKWLLNLGVVVHPCHLNTWEVEVGGPGVWHHSVCIAESGASLGCMSPYLKKKRRNDVKLKVKCLNWEVQVNKIQSFRKWQLYHWNFSNNLYFFLSCIVCVLFVPGKRSF